MRILRVVADSSCLISLAQVKQFELLKELFLEVYITDAVYDEVVVNGIGEPGWKETESAVKKSWIVKKTVKDEVALNVLMTTLGKGESEAIILYKELKLDYALIDEKMARDMAELMNVNTMGVLGIIDFAVKKGFPIDKKKVVDQLKNSGFRISDKLYKKVISNED